MQSLLNIQVRLFSKTLSKREKKGIILSKLEGNEIKLQRIYLFQPLFKLKTL